MPARWISSRGTGRGSIGGWSAGSTPLTLLWADGKTLILCDHRLYAKDADGLTKNDHFRAMLDSAEAQGSAPACVVFDSWYASLTNLKAVRGCGWCWVTQHQRNRLVNPDGTGTRPLADCAIAEGGTRVHLQGYGFVLVFRIVSPDGDTEYWASSDLALADVQRRKYAELARGIETDHRASGSTVRSSGRRSAPPAPGATTAPAPSGRSCAWRSAVLPPASADGKPRPTSSAPPSRPTSPRRLIPSPQLRNP